MSDTRLAAARAFASDKLLMGQAPRTYLRSLVTPTDAIAATILVLGLPVIAYRFWAGLGSVTNLTQDSPWGLWIGFDILVGVALAAGGYTLAAAVHLFGLTEYRSVVRPAILTGFLGYVFAVLGLLCDLGQPWRVPYPVFYSFGTTSVMFEVGWCVFLYLMVLGLEFSPAALEWLGWLGLKRRVSEIMLGLICAGVVLSTLHQSSLGSLFLTAPGRLHPLWYTPLIPVLFFVSSVAAGLSMVIVESSLSHRLFRDRLNPAHDTDIDSVVLGLAKGGAVITFAYVFLRLQTVIDGGRLDLLATPYGALWAIEVFGFFLVPSLLFARAVHQRRAGLARVAGAMAVLGVVLTRLDASLVAFNWQAAQRYVPSAAEVMVSLTIVTCGVLCFRFVVNRMPVLDAPAH
jgi:Ni/Fe-hydrogenase subunit HybB-like protein